MNEAKAAPKSKMKFWEYIGYSCGEMGYTMQNGIVAAYMVMYFTNAVGIKPLVIGTMTLICRIVDAFSDIGFGLLADKTNTRLGKFRPWYISSVIPCSLAFFLMFFVPNGIGTGSAMAVLWMYIMYILWGSVFATIQYTWLNAHPAVATADPKERRTMSTWRQWGASLIGVAISYLGIDLIIKFNMPEFMMAGGQGSPMSYRTGYMVMGLIVGGISLVLTLVAAICCKERIKAAEQEKNTVPFKEGFKTLKGNRLLIGAMLLNVMMFFLATFSSGFTSYFFENWYGDPSVIGSVMGTACIIGLVFNTLVTPILNKKLRAEQLHIIAVCGIILTYVIMYVVPPTGLIGYIIAQGIFQSMIQLANAMFFRTVPDAIDWGEWKHGVYAPGIIASTSFVQKVGMGIASFFLTAVLTIVGYNEVLAASGQPQTQTTVNGIHTAYLIVPIIIVLLTLVGYFIIRSVPKSELLQMRKDLAEKRGIEFDEKTALN